MFRKFVAKLIRDIPNPTCSKSKKILNHTFCSKALWKMFHKVSNSCQINPKKTQTTSFERVIR